MRTMLGKGIIPWRKTATISRAVVIILFILWLEFMVQREYLDPLFVAPPSEIFRMMLVQFTNQNILQAYGITAIEVILGFLIGAIPAILLGISIGVSRYLDKAFTPIVLLVYSIPKITLLPLFILFFGIYINSKIAFGAAHAFFPIILSAIGGTKTVDASLITAAVSMGATRSQVFRSVIIPHTIYPLITGLRLGMNFALLGVLLAELFVSRQGIGYYVRVYTSGFETAELYAVVVVIALIAIFLNEVMRAVEKRLSRWQTG
ncbi:MAG: ABC transporter permease [Chloroflexi bacterium]|nr:ABC transporter permease [Chloroflexota bacterium]